MGGWFRAYRRRNGGIRGGRVAGEGTCVLRGRERRITGKEVGGRWWRW